MSHRCNTTVLLLSLLLFLPTAAFGQVTLSLENADFETGDIGAVPTGWTPIANAFWIGNSAIGGADPGGGYQSSQFISASRQYPDLASSALGGDSYDVSLFQDIDLSAHTAAIVGGNQYLGVSYAYFDIDGLDIGSISYDYYDSEGSFLSTGYSGTTEAGGGWEFIEATSDSPVPR